MGFGINQITEVVISIAFIAFFAIFLSRNASRIFKKSNNDKLMLKELLERFDLDLPDELKEVDGSVVKPLKSR